MDAANATTVGNCKACKKSVNFDDYLECSECHNYVHTKCLEQGGTPGDLVGDVFFEYICRSCMEDHYAEPTTSAAAPQVWQQEKITRKHLPWIVVITLAIHNLTIKSMGLSRQGYFHWRTHISHFIETNWSYIFGPNINRPKKWLGSVSSLLSVHNPNVFQSGQKVFGETGWWKLTVSNMTPLHIYKQVEQHRNERRGHRVQIGSTVNRDSTEEQEETINYGCSRAIPYMGCQPRSKKAAEPKSEPSNQEPEPLPESANFNPIQSSLMDFLAENLSNDDLSLFTNLPEAEPLIDCSKKDFLSLLESPHEDKTFGEHVLPMDKPSNSNTAQDCQLKAKPNGKRSGKRLFESSSSSEAEEEEKDEFAPRIVQVTTFQPTGDQDANRDPPTTPMKVEVESNDSEEKDENKEELDNDDEAAEVRAKSLFTRNPQREYPWLLESREYFQQNFETTNGSDQLTPMSLYEEKEMLMKLRKVFSLESKCSINIPAHIRRFYRKLCIRERNREHSRPVFNLDQHLDKSRTFNQATDQNLIDRYQLIASTPQLAKKTFYARIAGTTQCEMFESPYTQRVLHPYIYRNQKCFPPWLKLMCEVQYAVNGVPPKRAPIDFLYVRPNHIAAVNALLQTLFWPGIDMTECLNYPDFSVVAMYKKLVVGCGFLIPDVGYNEAYISFMAVRPGWQRDGIATFMLYHLIQTCMSKDITLHVSATNPAVVLYQKFGFKIEEVILNFYDKYLPIDSKHSRNAFFLRLTR